MTIRHGKQIDDPPSFDFLRDKRLRQASNEVN